MKEYKLPTRLYSKHQVEDIAAEVAQLLEQQQNQRIRSQYGQDQSSEPAPSTLLQEFLTANGWTVKDLAAAKDALDHVRQHAPVMHCTLPRRPQPGWLRELAEWFRAHVHPLTLLTVRVDRTILGGMVARGTNQVWDFSIRRMFHNKRDQLKQVIADVE